MVNFVSNFGAVLRIYKCFIRVKNKLKHEKLQIVHSKKLECIEIYTKSRNA